MADDQLAGPSEPKASWTKLFSAFRVALDLKKLLLAAGGMVATAAGWWVLAAIFYKAEAPDWLRDYAHLENKDEAWQDFKRDRKRWNLMHEMAAPAPEKASDAVLRDAADVADTLKEYTLLDGWLKAYRAKTKTLAEIEADPQGNADAVATFHKSLLIPAVKPVGRLRSWPWNEYRGPNQYLLVEGLLRKDTEGYRNVPWEKGQFLGWLISDQLPVLVEPLTKFLAPIGYFFNSSAGGFRVRMYLILMILWTLAVWGFFGGAICRIAAVQLARNEKISLGEAIGFAKMKFLNLFTAPLFPLIFLGILTFFLAFFGLLGGFTYFFGDIFLAGLLYPVVIVLGLIMAVVVVGLVGWSLMNPTIAAEGSDNFDALSRSYSYVYQAFWHYLGYWGMALVYGAALVFFVGFMGSLVVYLGKWGLSQAPGLQSAKAERDRDPAYLFYYAPTSFAWRDLLIKDNPHVEQFTVVTAGGMKVPSYRFKDTYEAEISVPNTIGAVLVGVWIGLFFLLVVGFSYSYFWTASTIIYFLMRKHVDDTEMSEVYFEEGDLEPPGPGAAPPMPPPVVAAKPGAVSLNVVESPPISATAPAPVATPPPAPAVVVAPPASDHSHGNPPPATP